MHGHKTSHLPIRYFLALLWAHPILHISTIRVKMFTDYIRQLHISAPTGHLQVVFKGT